MLTPGQSRSVAADKKRGGAQKDGKRLSYGLGCCMRQVAALSSATVRVR